MLRIRLKRVGKKNQPSFRFVVTDRQKGPKTGRVVENIGSYNPTTKENSLDTERAKYWIGVGAQPTGTVHNMLVEAGVLSDEKINVLPQKSPVVHEAPSEDAPAEEEKPAEKPEEKSDKPEATSDEDTDKGNAEDTDKGSDEDADKGSKEGSKEVVEKPAEETQKSEEQSNPKEDSKEAEQPTEKKKEEKSE